MRFCREVLELQNGRDRAVACRLLGRRTQDNLFVVGLILVCSSLCGRHVSPPAVCIGSNFRIAYCKQNSVIPNLHVCNHYPSCQRVTIPTDSNSLEVQKIKAAYVIGCLTLYCHSPPE